MTDDTETRVTAVQGWVTYRMLPYIARELATLLDERARQNNDSGWREDAKALFAAADKEEGK